MKVEGILGGTVASEAEEKLAAMKSFRHREIWTGLLLCSDNFQTSAEEGRAFVVVVDKRPQRATQKMNYALVLTCL